MPTIAAAREPLYEIPADAAQALTPLGRVVLPLLGGDLVRLGGSEAVALEESLDTLGGGAGEDGSESLLRRALQGEAHEVPADPFAEKSGERVEGADLPALRGVVRQ